MLCLMLPMKGLLVILEIVRLDVEFVDFVAIVVVVVATLDFAIANVEVAS